MEIVYASAIGILAGSGVWLVLRPRTFQVLLGLTLLSYATNLFIFGMGRLELHRPPIIDPAIEAASHIYADPVPQALVLTAIVLAMRLVAGREDLTSDADRWEDTRSDGAVEAQPFGASQGG